MFPKSVPQDRIRIVSHESVGFISDTLESYGFSAYLSRVGFDANIANNSVFLFLTQVSFRYYYRILLPLLPFA